MYAKKIATIFEEAKKLNKQNVPIEVEVRFGTIVNGNFKAGVSVERFRFIREWMESSNIKTSNWSESVATFIGKYERCIITKTGNKNTTNIEKVEKKPVANIVLKTNHPEGIALKLCLYTEKPINPKTTGSSNVVRLRNRKSYIINSKGYDNTFSLDFTQVWQGTSERQVRELQRASRDTVYEVEFELTNNEYLANMTSNYLTDSLLGKCKGLIQPEMEVGKAIEFTIV